MDCFLEVEMRAQRREIVGVVVHVMAVTGLGGANMAAPVVRNDAIAVLEEEHGIEVAAASAWRTRSRLRLSQERR